MGQSLGCGWAGGEEGVADSSGIPSLDAWVLNLGQWPPKDPQKTQVVSESDGKIKLHLFPLTSSRTWHFPQL